MQRQYERQVNVAPDDQIGPRRGPTPHRSLVAVQHVAAILLARHGHGLMHDDDAPLR